jgi:enoyl-[acyl-carrier protein] reductase II
MKTALTELLQVEHPAMLAVAWASSVPQTRSGRSPTPVASVALGASTMSQDQLVDEMALTRAAAKPPLRRRLAHRISRRHGSRRIELDYRSGSNRLRCRPRRTSRLLVVDLCHRNNVIVASMCGKVDHAKHARDAGCDLVVAQGTEAGGHTGTVATMPLVPLIVDAVGDDIPVVAAGGIFDGRGLAAALALGACGVWVGTRFIATP